MVTKISHKFRNTDPPPYLGIILVAIVFALEIHILITKFGQNSHFYS